MNHIKQRKRMRALLAGDQCLSPASVYDPLSAAVAESVGYRLGLLSGSQASATTLAAPDLVLQTLTEFADQIRRIMRSSDLCLLIDADHGYGNALNVMRTVEECEHAGVTAIGIEDSVLPTAFGDIDGREKLVSIAEAVGKLRSALAARKDPSTVIAARTVALKAEGIDSLVERAKAYDAAGVDAIWMTSLNKLDDLDRVRTVTSLPIILGSERGSFTHDELAAKGVRIALQGHLPLRAAIKALRMAYEHLYAGGTPADLKPYVATTDDIAKLTRERDYDLYLKEYMNTQLSFHHD